jgi:hypothetical protein
LEKEKNVVAQRKQDLEKFEYLDEQVKKIQVMMNQILQQGAKSDLDINNQSKFTFTFKCCFIFIQFY